jgi:hypothetical protein
MVWAMPASIINNKLSKKNARDSLENCTTPIR